MENSSLKIRPAELKDTQYIVSFNKLMALETEGKVLNDNAVLSGVQAVISDRAEAFYLIAEDEQTSLTIASLMITREWSDWRNSFIWWIQSVYVSPEYRQKGVYRSLYNEVKRLASAANCCAVRLYVDQDNSAARQAYIRLGMKNSNYIIFEDDKL